MGLGPCSPPSKLQLCRFSGRPASLSSSWDTSFPPVAKACESCSTASPVWSARRPSHSQLASLGLGVSLQLLLCQMPL